MKNDTSKIDILDSKNQLELFGYRDHFNSFIKLFTKKKFPNTILLSGLKGSGKATFTYHFINYLLSYNEEKKYSITDLKIDSKNKSYINLCNNTHPNFFLLDTKKDEENIKIDNVRNILKFINKSTFNNNIKIVMIDNAEYLNINSSNALLKVLEEPIGNTFFFVIDNNTNKILNTIKSRCIQFKIFFNTEEKKKILKSLNEQYDDNFILEKLHKNFYLDSPGSILRYVKILNDDNIEFKKDKLSCIFHLIDKYRVKKDSQLLTLISFLIEIFYYDLSLSNNNKLNIYFYNKFKILKQISDMKKFNLDKNNYFITLQGVLKNES